MLPKINRLKKKKDFEHVFKNSRAIKIIPIVARMVKNKLSESRIGIVVSQKISKKATTRNKVRRRISEAVKIEMGKIRTGVDIVLITMPGIEKLDFLEIKNVVEKILTKLKLIEKNV